MIGTIATVLTATIINVAIPDVMGTFGMGQDKAQLLSTGFLAAMTGTMLLNAFLLERVGRRTTYLLAMAVFVGASILGGLAPGELVLILARVLQGAAAGIIQPLAMQVIFQVFPPERRGTAMGIFGVGVVLAPAIGPTLGGLMVDSFSWRYVFFFPVPFALMAMALARLFLPGREHSERPAHPFDGLGFALIVAFLVSLLSALSNGVREGWLSDPILIAFTVAVLSGLAFVAWEMWTAHPLLDPRLFASPTFAGASVVAFIFGFGLFGSTYLIPLFVQSIQGYTPTRSGLLLMPAGLVLAMVFPLAGRLSDSVPAPALIAFGLVLFGASLLLMGHADTNTPFWLMAGWIVFGRIGLGFILPSLNAGALRALPLRFLGQGAGTINFVRQLGGALGVNLLAIALTHQSQQHTDALTATQVAGNAAMHESVALLERLFHQGGVPAMVQEPAALHFLGRIIQAQGSMLGYRDGFMLTGAVSLAALVPVLMMAFGHRIGRPTGR
ncbi:DHA2 family efflux MFS transporter permease subunit [Roseospira marina]|uniref:DHA2 family efflux MFS transporter permease subunit n=2 Tax=Roseospira marina TaxID=140057 RepID=A0A5M6IG82_9PROT|nr:DHA2 family efflux MFS transporter permease subunit [Roseospira marina]